MLAESDTIIAPHGGQLVDRQVSDGERWERIKEAAGLPTCPHDPSFRVFHSGTKVREMLFKGEHPPAQFSRLEVVEILIEGMSGTL